MSAHKQEKIAFQVETERVLEILSREIYDSPLALLRENVQNAYDAVLMRCAEEQTDMKRSDTKFKLIWTPDLVTARNRCSSGLSPNRGWANSNKISESGLIRQPVRFRVDTLDHARHRHSPTRCRPRELPTAESAHESGDKVLSLRA